MAPVRVSRGVVEGLAGRECGWSEAEGDVVEITTGFGSHNWRVPRSNGDLVLKVGSASSAAKWAAAQVGADRAREAGLAVPELLSVAVADEYVVRTFRWVNGKSAQTLVTDPNAQTRLGSDLGAAVAALHSLDVEAYTSRLDGSSEAFSTWAGYVNDRLVAIEQRAMNAPEPALRRRASLVIEKLARSISSECRPVLCHRDLHPDNLIVLPDGALAGIIDWDMTEAWDAAGEWFKLELFLFEQLPHARDPFETAYKAAAGSVDPNRRRLVLLMESLNVVANADVFADTFIDFGIRQLEELT